MTAGRSPPKAENARWLNVLKSSEKLCDSSAPMSGYDPKPLFGDAPLHGSAMLEKFHSIG